LKEKVERDGGFMQSVSDLADIVYVLNQVRNGGIPINFEISSIDLIGHASPGEISVGRSVFGARTSLSVSLGTRHHVLNSDPHASPDIAPLAEMKPPLLSDQVPLRLLGCHTASDRGSGEPSELIEIDGRVLLLALANMLRCKV